MARTAQTARGTARGTGRGPTAAAPGPISTPRVQKKKTAPAPKPTSTMAIPTHPSVLPDVPAKHADFISYLHAHPDAEVADLIEPYKLYDAKLRQVFAQEPHHPALADLHLNVVPLFTGEKTALGCRGRNPVFQTQEENDKYIMPLKDEERKPFGAPAIVQTFKEFQTNFNLFSESSLADMDWSNVVAAGSSVVTPLLPVPEKYAGSKRGLRQYYHEILAPASDVDLFIYGLSEEEAIEKIKQIETKVKDAILEETTTVRTKNAITIASHYPTRHIQIVLRIYKSVAEILTGFDVDCSCAAYDGKQVYATPRAIASYVTQRNTIDLTRRSPSYENRLSKYSHRGFEVYWPQLDRSKIDPTIFERNFGRTVGLARLLVLEKLPKSSDRDDYLDQRRREKGRPAINRHNRRRFQLNGNIKDNYEDEVADWVEDEEVSDYHTFTVPYGEKFQARKIEKLLYTKDLLLNAEWNKPKDREVNLHRHPAFFGSVNDVIHDCCGYCPKPHTLEEEEVAKEESAIYVSGDISFIKDDPGRQAIGSFNPLTDDDWTEMAYVGNTARLCQAIVEHEFDVVQQCLEEGIDPNTRDYTGRTPLQLAVQTSTPEIVKCLVERGARMVARLADGRTALHIAAAKGNAEMVKILLDQSAVNEEEEAKKQDAKRAAWLAAKKEAGEPVPSEGEALSAANVEKSEHKDSKDEASNDDASDEDSAMSDDSADIEMRSATTGSFVHVQPDKAPNEGDNMPSDEDDDEPDIYDINVLAWDTPCSPLHLAIVNGHGEVVKQLVQDFGADVLLPVKLLNDHDRSPRAAILTLVLSLRLSLDEARKMTQLLLSLGASSAQADMDQITALHRFVGQPPVLLEDLFAHDAPAAKRALNHVAVTADRYRPSTLTPLLSAIAAKAPVAANKLLDNGAKLEIQFAEWIKSHRQRNSDADRHSTDYHEKQFRASIEQPVMAAALTEQPELVARMLDSGADPNVLTAMSWELVDGARPYEEGQALIDVVRAAVVKLKGYTGESTDHLQEPKKPFEGDGSQFLEPFEEGGYQRFAAARAVKFAKDMYETQLENFKEQKMHFEKRAGTKEKRDAVDRLLLGFEKLEMDLVARGAKTFKELHPKVEGHKRDNRGFPRWKPEQRDFSLRFQFLLPDLTDVRREAYVRLFEAAWKGDLSTIKALTLSVWGPQNADGQQEKPLQIAVQDDTPLSPFSIAVQRGHHDVAKAILEIAQAQYQPAENTEKAKYSMVPEYSDDEASDDGSTQDEIQVYKEIIDDEFTVENIGEVSMQVKSNVSPLGMLNWNCSVPKRQPSDGERCNRNLIQYAIQTDELGLLKLLLQWGAEYTSLQAQTSDDAAPARFYSVSSNDLDYAIGLGRIRHIAEIIRSTGAGMPIDQLVKKSGTEIKERPKFYQGLSVYGKKRADWADAGRGVHRESPQDQHPPLLQAAFKGNLDSVEWFMGDAPLRLYLEWAERNGSDKRLKGLAKAEGGFEKAVAGWLGTRQNLLVSCVTISNPPADTAFKLLDYTLKALPKSLEAKDSSGRTPLYLAFHLERPNVAAHLIRAGANQATRTHEGNNLLHALLTNGIPHSSRMPAPWFHNNAPHPPSAKPDLSPLRALLESIDPRLLPSLLTERSSAGPTGANTPLSAFLAPLHFNINLPDACDPAVTSAVAILNLLLDVGGAAALESLDLVNGAGDTPLHVLVRGGSVRMIEAVLNRRPELLHRENSTGRTPAECSWDAWVAEGMQGPPAVKGGAGRFGWGSGFGGGRGVVDAGVHEFAEGGEQWRGGDGYRKEKSRVAVVWELVRERMVRDGVIGGAGKAPQKRKLVSLGEANEVAKRLAKRQDRGDRGVFDQEVEGDEGKEDEVQMWSRRAGKGKMWDWEV